MSKSKERQPAKGQESPQPVNVIDGIPDRTPKPRVWMYVLCGAVFVLWLAFLIYCAIAGNV